MNGTDPSRRRRHGAACARAAALLVLACGAAGHALAGGAGPSSPAPPHEVLDAALPAVTLVDQDGTPRDLRALLDASQPTALTFIFTTCRSICPALTSAMANVRREFPGARYVSISIDPEYDTPEVLRAYAHRFGADADPHWRFLTGTAGDVAAVQRAFRAYAGDKNAHQPVIFLKRRGARSWTRFDTTASPSELAAELRGAAGGGRR